MKMPKPVRIALKIAGGILATLVVLALVGVTIVAVQRITMINKAKGLMTAPAGQLVVDGLTFRDLNKNGRLDPYEDRRVPVDARVENLLGQMTLEEKAGMLFHTPVFPGKKGQIAGALEPTNFTPVEYELFTNRINYFNVFFLGTPAETAHWTNEVQHLAERTRLGIPATFSSDPRHSAAQTVASFRQQGFSKWTDPIGFAALRDENVTRRFGQVAAREYRSMGLQVALHPMADLATEPRWARISGTFGEDADLTSRMVTAYIEGFQGQTLGPDSVATTTKHFAGGGPQKDGLDPHFRFGKDQVYPGHNLAYHLIPFRAAIAANTSLIMPYYGVPVGLTSEDVGFNFNREMVTGLLREQMGYTGITVTDWGVITPTTLLGFDIEPIFPIGAVKDYGVENLTPTDRALKSLIAGIDQFGGEDAPEYIINLVHQGRLSEARIDESVRRLLALKFRLGQFENPYVDETKVAERVGRPEDIAAGLAEQRASQILLTNQPANGQAGRPILPLAPRTRIFVQNLDPAVAARYGQVVDKIEDADVAIINLAPPFDHSLPNGNLVHQGRLYFSEEELKPVLEIARKKPTIVTFYMERPLIIPELARETRAVVANFGASDDAILDVIFGRAAPQGRLPFDMPSTWASVLAQKPDVPFDSANPLFRFGYGLSYASPPSAPQRSPR